jgi:hypothetical protein
MADKKKEVTPKDITDWLKANPTKRQGRGGRARTDIRDAKKALGYEGPALKIREGNLGANRSKLRITLKGRSDYANEARRRNQEQTTPNRETRLEAERTRRAINRKGLVADHILTNSRLARGERAVEETRGKAGVNQMRQRLAANNSGYGHSAGNLQALTNLQNGAKEVQERLLDQLYNHLSKKPAVTSKKFQAWENKRSTLASKIASNYNANRPPSLTIQGSMSMDAENVISTLKQLSPLNQSSAAYGGIERQTNEAMLNMMGVNPGTALRLI